MSQINYSWAKNYVDVKSSVYMSSSYQNIFALYDGAQFGTLLFGNKTSQGSLPLLIRELKNGKKEAYSAYGYGGVKGGPELSSVDVESMAKFLSLSGIVSLFVRHSPFFKNQMKWPPENIELNRYTYITHLAGKNNLGEYISKIPQKLRWSINFATRAGLKVLFQKSGECTKGDVTRFYRLYKARMIEKKSSLYYIFSENFFIDHITMLGSNCELAEIFDPSSGELLAAAFFLLDNKGYAHYHLSATHPRAMKMQAMELLLVSAISRYSQQGFEVLHLGGGHSLSEEDGLSRFKLKFADEKLEFYCTKLVCDEFSYRQIRDSLSLRYPEYFLIRDALGS